MGRADSRGRTGRRGRVRAAERCARGEAARYSLCRCGGALCPRESARPSPLSRRVARPECGRAQQRLGKGRFSAALSERGLPAFHGMLQPELASGAGPRAGFAQGIQELRQCRRTLGRHVGVSGNVGAYAVLSCVPDGPVFVCGVFPAVSAVRQEKAGEPSPAFSAIRSFCSGQSYGLLHGPCARAGCCGRLPRCRRCRPCCRGPRRSRWRPRPRLGPPIR